MSTEAHKLLKQHGLRNTPFRMHVLNIFLDNKEKAISNSIIEKTLDGFDRITLYRTLKSFEKSGIIHHAIDGSNNIKYALCNDNCDVHNHNDDHAHFLCSACGNTTCIDHIMGEPLKLPANYTLDKVDIALTGVCPSCQ